MLPAVRAEHGPFGKLVIIGRDAEHGLLGIAILHAVRKRAHFRRSLTPMVRIVDVACGHGPISRRFDRRVERVVVYALNALLVPGLQLLRQQMKLAIVEAERFQRVHGR